MKYILVLLFLISCGKSVDRTDSNTTWIVSGDDTVVVSNGIIDVSKARGGTDGSYDTLTGILTVTFLHDFPIRVWEEPLPDTFLIYEPR